MEAFEDRICGCTKIHLMRINDLRLLLEVEALSLLHNHGILELILEILLIS